MPDLLRRVSELPPHTIVYFLSFFEDGHGSKFDELKALDRVAAAANVPTYAWIDTRAGHGSVGGTVLNVESAAGALANVALRVLEGRITRQHPRARDRPQHHPIRLAAAPALGHQRNPAAGRVASSGFESRLCGISTSSTSSGRRACSCCRPP